MTPPAVARWIEPELPPGWPADGFGPLPVLVEQIPAPADVGPGAWVGLLPSRRSPAGFLARSPWLASLLRRAPAAHLALRCTALLARGYEQVGAGRDEHGREVAWGRAPLATG